MTTYTPQTTVFDLTEDDFLPNASSSPAAGTTNIGPVVIQQKNIADQDNDIQVEYLDRNNKYATAIAEAVDQAQIDTDRRRYSGSQSAHIFADIRAANVSAQLLLQKEWLLNTYFFDLDARYIVLDPMDLVTITEAYLGLYRKQVRITEITENSDGTLSFTAEDVLIPTYSPAQHVFSISSHPKLVIEPPVFTAEYSWRSGEGYDPNYNAAPGTINTPIMFVAPSELTNGSLEMWIGVSGSSAVWGGCTISISTDNETYSVIGSVTSGSRTGQLTTTLQAT